MCLHRSIYSFHLTDFFFLHAIISSLISHLEILSFQTYSPPQHSHESILCRRPLPPLHRSEHPYRLRRHGTHHISLLRTLNFPRPPHTRRYLDWNLYHNGYGEIFLSLVPRYISFPGPHHHRRPLDWLRPQSLPTPPQLLLRHRWRSVGPG